MNSKNINVFMCNVQNISHGDFLMCVYMYIQKFAYFIPHHMARKTQKIWRKPYFILSDFFSCKLLLLFQTIKYKTAFIYLKKDLKYLFNIFSNCISLFFDLHILIIYRFYPKLINYMVDIQFEMLYMIAVYISKVGK